MSFACLCRPALLVLTGRVTATAAQAQSSDTIALRLPSSLRITDSATAARPASHLSAEWKVDRPVRVRYCPEPVYPRALAQYGFSGHVVLVFVVGTSGRAEMDDLVISETAHEGFIGAARHTISKCRFDPAEKSGRPVRYLVEQRINFLQRPTANSP